MISYSKQTSFRNQQLDLFDWHRDRELRRSNWAARRIARQFGLPLHSAVTISRLAGIGSEANR
jgi:hypothetical protein